MPSATENIGRVLGWIFAAFVAVGCVGIAVAFAVFAWRLVFVMGEMK